MLKIMGQVSKIMFHLQRRINSIQHNPKSCIKALFSKSHFSSNKPESVYLVDEDKSPNHEIKNNVNKYTQRSHTCGELRMEHVGQYVVLCGWLEFQRMNKFVTLRDSYGATQLLIMDQQAEIQKVIQTLPLESIIQIKGTVLSRPDNMKNEKQATGDIEVRVEDFLVLNKSKDTLPFNIREFQKAKESLRMQYRYLDLRFPLMQRNLRIRSEMIMRMREFLVNHSGFVDVETPTLFKATPGGAQEFIVPTRFPGQFYSLVQSPQQFKQMLMAGAIDRYFQIARCYRDEGARPDRQPEFTQLDIEMSFTSLSGILELVENLLAYCWPDSLGTLPENFERMSYGEVMEQYGSDQPDVRFNFKLKNCTDVMEKHNNPEFGAYCVNFPQEYSTLTKVVKENFKELSKHYPLVKFLQIKANTLEEFVSKLGKVLPVSVATELLHTCKIKEDSTLFLAYGDKTQAQKLLGKIRVDYVDHLEKLGLSVKKKGMHLLWVIDMPLFELGRGENNFKSAHHPFTSPHPDDMHLLEKAPLEVRSLSFDLVLNGNEIGGGSVRIHDAKLQERIFKMLGIEKRSMQHILDMLSSGCPPHGGIALGIDRMMSKILNTTSIRDVIAFPKTFEGRDPLSGAPSVVSEEDQKLYHVKSIYPDK